MVVEKASITNVDGGGAPIECMFNPTEYTFYKQNRISFTEVPGTSMPIPDFRSGDPATMKLQLFFDTYEAADGAKDVRKHTDAIWNLMAIEESTKDTLTGRGRPPIVHFQWGRTWSFDAMIRDISQRFTLFLPDGTPVRATLDVTFQQVKDGKLFPKQNPTSGGTGGERQWTVQEGDTLSLIAYRMYGDCNQWRQIAEANRLTRVRRLQPGTVLEIPNA
jgi:Contractile injection system tube protein/LysM domain